MNHPIWDYITKHRDALTRYAASQLPPALRDHAEDVVQQVVWKTRNRSTDERCTIPSYVYKAVARECIDVLRKNGRTVTSLAVAETEVDDGGLHAVEVAALLDDVMHHLPDEWRDAVILKAHGLKDQECADAVGITLPAHKCRLNRAHKFLSQFRELAVRS